LGEVKALEARGEREGLRQGRAGKQQHFHPKREGKGMRW
jgi:hypothetical protein